MRGDDGAAAHANEGHTRRVALLDAGREQPAAELALHLLAVRRHARDKLVEGGTKPLGRILFTQYLLPFEVLSILLLVAMVGVILLSKKDLK